MIIFLPLAFSALFPVVNPIGTAILFLNLTEDAPSKLRRSIARKIAANSLVLMVLTLILGLSILRLFGLSIPVVQLCGGLILFYMGWQSLHSHSDGNDASSKEYVREDVGSVYENQAFYPFTFPLTIGPGTIATTLTLSAEASKTDGMIRWENYAGIGIAMVLVAAIIYISYGYSDVLVTRLSPNLRKVIMRLLNFILLCIGGQITINGIHAIMMTF
ncbi:MAG: MarC family protein [Bacteroidota bacterium]|nr:MarC family protein [Bacteroidota bacterium]MDX5430652.1 MarC family protein [Bacteroidota bacterium]